MQIILQKTFLVHTNMNIHFIYSYIFINFQFFILYLQHTEYSLFHNNVKLFNLIFQSLSNLFPSDHKLMLIHYMSV